MPDRRPRRRRAPIGATLAAAAAMLASGVRPAAAQSWRTISVEKQRVAVDTLHVRMLYGAGTLDVGAAPRRLLYDLRARFDAGQTRPTHRYDSATATLTVGADSSVAQVFAIRRSWRGGSTKRYPGGSLSLELARDVPLDLDLQIGATQARVDLSGLSVSRLALSVAASEAQVSFGAANPVRMSELTLKTAAGALTVNQLGNARAARVSVSAGVGDVTLDMAGDWTDSLALDLHAVLGQLTVRVPRDVGVEARVSKVLGGVDSPGFTQRDGAFYSANWGSADRKLVVTGDVALAGVEFVVE